MYLLHHHDEGFDSYQIMTLEEAQETLKQGVQNNSCALNEYIYSDEFDSLVLNEVISKEDAKKHEHDILEYMAVKILTDLDEMEKVTEGYTVYYEGREYVALVKIKNDEGTRY